MLFFYVAECLLTLTPVYIFALVYGIPVPSPVKGLQADSEHTTHSLVISWDAPVGVYDGYSVQLLDEDEAMVANVSVRANITYYLFEGLVPGRIYTVHLKTLSNTSYSKDVIAKGQTRKRHMRSIFACLDVECRNLHLGLLLSTRCSTVFLLIYDIRELTRG